VFKFRELLPTGNRWNRALFTGQKKTKFRLPLKLSQLRGSRPKSARANPQQRTQSAPDFIQIGSLSAELIAERMNTAKLPHKVNPIFGRSLASSRIVINILALQ